MLEQDGDLFYYDLIDTARDWYLVLYQLFSRPPCIRRCNEANLEIVCTTLYLTTIHLRLYWKTNDVQFGPVRNEVSSLC